MMKLYKADHVLPISGPAFPEGGLLVDEAGKIRDIGSFLDLKKKHAGVEILVFEKSLLMPALVNAHTSLELLSFEWAHDSRDPIEWLCASSQYRKQIPLSEKRTCFQEGILQLLRHGVTCVGDTGSYKGVLEMVKTAPIDFVLFPHLLHTSPERIQDQFQEVMGELEIFLEIPSLRTGIFLYSAYTLSTNLLKLLGNEVQRLGIPLQIHAAESFDEMEFFYESRGPIVDRLFPRLGWTSGSPPAYRQTPIRFLDHLGLIHQGTSLIGGQHLTGNDLSLMRRKKTRLITTPRRAHRLGYGLPAYSRLIESNIPTAVATGEMAIYHNLSLWEEIRELSRSQEKISADHLLAMITLGGAYALGLEQERGSFEEGKVADFLVIDLSSWNQTQSPGEWLVREGGERLIRDVYKNGKRISRVS